MNGPTYSRRARAALILSPDPLGAALIGAATELSGLRPAYPADQESPTDAIRRLKPVAVLVDAAHAIVTDQTSLGPALMTGAALVFYGTATQLRDLKLIRARGETIVLPDDIDQLPALLSAIIARHAGRARSE